MIRFSAGLDSRTRSYVAAFDFRAAVAASWSLVCVVVSHQRTVVGMLAS